MRFFEICKSFYESRLFAIAAITARETTRQPLFSIIIGGGCLIILCSFFFTLFAFGEEVRMIKDMGVSTILMCCLCLASFSTTSTIAKEREKGTLITLLCKPVGKRSIIVGKFLGILAALSCAFLVMGAFLIISLGIKGSFEYHRGFFHSLSDVGYSTLLVLFFSFLQVAIIASIALAGSVYLPVVSNLCLCLFVYVMGHLICSFQNFFNIHESIFLWYMPLFFIFLPNLGSFTISGVGNISESFHLSYMISLAVYAILYITLITILAVELFDKRECK